MATMSKTQGILLQAWADVASGAVLFSSVRSVATTLAGTFFIKLARKSSTAFTVGWPNVRIEASALLSGAEWYPLTAFRMAQGVSVGQTTLAAASFSGDVTFSVTSATNIAPGDLVFLSDTVTTNYELVRVKSVVGTTVTPEETLLNNHTSGALVCTQSEMYSAQIDLTAVGRLRVAVDNANGGVGIASQVYLVTGDSFA